MCIFCKIVAGEIPAHTVYEDDKYLAFLDISQATIGHTLVIPKKHYENFLDLQDSGELFEVAQTVTKQLSKSLDISDFNILNNTGINAGQLVNHFHLHIIPRYSEKDLCFKFKKNQLTSDEFLHLLEKIKTP